MMLPKAKRLWMMLLLCLLPVALPVTAESVIRLAADKEEAKTRYLAQIKLNTADELNDVLSRVETVYRNGKSEIGEASPVVFVLHGPEARVFLRENYSEHKEVVDLAARLSAFGVVDIQVCETWMGGDGLHKTQLQPFIDTVPYWKSHEEQLKQQNYVYF